ncbi:MAG: radical SAM protein, partial [Thermodesulfobacteriota bacterium]
TVLGNIHPTLLPRETLGDNTTDFIVRGEGEETFIELLNVLSNSKNNHDFSKIKGLSYRDGNTVVNNPDRECITDLDHLPYPAWHLFPIEKFNNLPLHWMIKKPCFIMMFSRGCPYRCTFCSLISQKPRYRKPKYVVDEMLFLAEQYGAKQIIFMDAAFSLNKKKVIELCNEMIKRGVPKKLVWLCETRVNHVDQEMLDKMYEAGCRRIAFGIESGVQSLLNDVKKGFTLDQARSAIRMCKKAKIETITFFMLGLPNETRDLSMKTIAFAKELDPDFAKFNLTVPYPGTKLYEDAVEDGTLKSMDWTYFMSNIAMTSYEPVYIPKNMTKTDLLEIQKIAIKQFYLRPRIIFRHILKIRSFDDIKHYLKTGWFMIKGIS